MPRDFFNKPKQWVTGILESSLFFVQLGIIFGAPEEISRITLKQVWNQEQMSERMKNSLKSAAITLLTAAILIPLPGCSSNRSDFADLLKNGGELRIYEVFGMGCPGCHGGLEDLVNNIPGVRASKANWEKQQLHVVLDPDAEIEDNAFHEAIKSANFTPGKRLK
jgi:copper chaperone CopZ